MAAVPILARMESPAFGDADVHLAELMGQERISELFDFSLVLVCSQGSAINVEDAVGAEATIVFEMKAPETQSAAAEMRELRRVHGVMAEVEELFRGVHRTYRVRLRPTMSYCDLVETLDIFMDLDLAGLIKKKLELVDLVEGEDFVFRLLDDYPEREFVVQYKETDLAFLSRQTEHWGVSFTFEHKDGRDVIVFTDNNDTFAEADEPLLFVERGDDHGVRELQSKTKMVPRMFVQRDYNYRNPGSDVTGTTTAGVGAGGIVEYGGHFKTGEEAERIANMRREEIHAGRRVFVGDCSMPTLSAGLRVTVSEHPLGDLPLLVTGVTHRLRQPVFSDEAAHEPYTAEFTAIAQDVPFRPRRVTPKPRVQGMVTGIIESSGSDGYADVDDDGRYRVRFMFDTSDAGEAKASRPVRMMQPHAGAGYGMHFPLRSGIEVLITFIDGDPDRPIIAGTVPNPQTASPVTSSNRAKNVIRTGGGNEIDIDDTEGSTRIKMTVPHSNTIFQLGADNYAEQGAAFSTTGAFTSVAASGTSTITSFGAGIQAFQDYKASGDIVSTASPPSKKWLAVLGIVQTAIGMAQAVLGLVKAGIEFHQKIALGTAIGKQDDVTDAQAACKKCREELAALEADLPASVQSSIQAEREDYDEAIAYQDELYLKSLNDRRLLDVFRDANYGATDHQNEAALGEQQRLYEEAYKTSSQTVKDFENTDHTDANGVSHQSVNGAKGDLETAITNAKVGLTGDDLAKVEAYEDKFESCVTKCQTDVKQKRKDADDALDDYRKVRDTHSDRSAEIEHAEKALGVMATVQPLVSAIMAIYTLLQKSKHLVELNTRWTTQHLALKDSGLRPNYAGAKTVAASPVHVIGSNKSTEINAIDDLLCWSEKVTLFGSATKKITVGDKEITVPDIYKGEVVINGSKDVYVAAGDKTQIAAKRLLKLSSHNIEIEAINSTGDFGDLKITSEKATAIKSNKDSIDISAPYSGKKIAMAAHTDITAATKNFTVTATEKAAIQSADGGGDAQLKLDKAGKIEAVTDKWSLKMDKSAGIKAGASGKAYLFLDDSDAQMKFSPSAMTVNKDKFWAKGPKVQIDATNGADITAKTGNTSVKGMKILLG